MSSKNNNQVSAAVDRRGFSLFLKSNLYAVLSHLGMTLFVIISSYLVVLLATRSINGDLFFLIELVALLLFLAYFLVCPALGLLLPGISGKVTRNNFVGCWLILSLMSIGAFLLGFFLQEGQVLTASPPAFIAPVLAQLDIFSPVLGILLMLYGGGAFLCYIYCAGMRMVWPTGLLKMLLGNIIILVVVYWSTYNAWVNDDDPYLLSLACFLIQFLALGGALFFGVTKAYVFGRSIKGRMKSFFVPLYIFNGLLTVAGVLLILSCFGLPNFIVELLYFLLHRLPEGVADPLSEYVSIFAHEFVSFFIGLCVLFLHGGGICGIIAAQTEKCKYCGLYACQKTTNTSETSQVTDYERVTETDTWFAFDRYGYDEHITRTTSDYEHVSGETKYVIHCAYCRRYLGSGKYKWSRVDKVDSNMDTEYNRHIWQ